MGTFDDLIPGGTGEPESSTGAFDDLVPSVENPAFLIKRRAVAKAMGRDPSDGFRYEELLDVGDISARLGEMDGEKASGDEGDKISLSPVGALDLESISKNIRPGVRLPAIHRGDDSSQGSEDEQRPIIDQVTDLLRLPVPDETLNLRSQRRKIGDQAEPRRLVLNNGVGRVQTAAGEFVKGAAEPVSFGLRAISEQEAQRSIGLLKTHGLVHGRRFSDEELEWMFDPRRKSEDVGLPFPTPYEVGEAIDKWAASLIETNPAYEQEFVAGKVPHAFGQMLGFTAITLASRGAGVPEVVGAGLAGAGVSSHAQFADALAHGATLDEAFRAGDLGALIGATEAVPIINILNRLDKGTGGLVKRSIVNGIKGGTEEAVQESMQSVLENLVASKIVKYDPTRGMWVGTEEGAAVGFTTGALLATMGTLFFGRRGNMQQAPAKPTSQREGFFQLKGLKLREEVQAKESEVLPSEAAPSAVLIPQDPGPAPAAPSSALLPEETTPIAQPEEAPLAAPESTMAEPGPDVQVPTGEEAAAEQAPPESPAPFQSETEVRRQRFAERAKEYGLTDDQVAELQSQSMPEFDEVTGFGKAEDRVPTLKRAQQHIKDTGDTGLYIEADLSNLGGLNAKLGHSGANEVYGEFTRRFREALEGTGGQVKFFRHGGDEFSAVAIGVDNKTVSKALKVAQKDILAYAKEQGLDQIPHTKTGMPSGTGVYFGAVAIDPAVEPKKLFSKADNKVERQKARKKYVNRETPAEDTGIPQSGAPPGRGAPGGPGQDPGSNRGGGGARGVNRAKGEAPKEVGSGEEVVLPATASSPSSTKAAPQSTENPAEAGISRSEPKENPAKEAPKARKPAAQEEEKPEPQGEAKPAPKKRKSKAEVDTIEDFGEKIGGARKDTAKKTGPRGEREKDERPGWMRRYEVNQIVRSTKPSENGRWHINDKKLSGRSRMRYRHDSTVYDSKEEAEAAIPLIEVKRNHAVGYDRDNDEYLVYRRVSDRKRVTIKDGFKSHDEAKRYIEDNAAKIIETKTKVDDSIRPYLEDVERRGPERRDGDASPEDFQKTFGFRGVEFGKWNNQNERQTVMNHAFDSLVDLAEVLSIPARAVSLNGELGLAFGARGLGRHSSKAHYERTYAVINLTKLQGAGALAHEWFHAFDHYLARQDTKASSEKVESARGGMVYKAKPSDYVSHGFRYASRSKAREELRGAFRKVMDTIFTKSEEYVEDTDKSKVSADKVRQSLENDLMRVRDELAKDYAKEEYQPYRGAKNNPASEAQIKSVDSIIQDILEKKGIDEKTINPPAARNKFSIRWTTDSLEKLSAVYKQVRGRNGFDSQNRRGIMDRLFFAIRRYKEAQQRLDEANEGKGKTRRVPSNYYSDSLKIDKGAPTDYWSTKHEMAARAFEAYVFDKIQETGNDNQFLSYGVENWHYMLHGLKPYPEGAERTAINQEFDSLFQTLKSKETDSGVVLYSRASVVNSDKKPRGMTVEAVEKVIESFREEFNGRPELEYIVARDQEAAFGPELQASGTTVKGGFYPRSNKITLIAANLSNARDARKTLRHEILAHYGLNLFPPDVKAQVLGKIRRARDSRSLRGVWEEVAREYPDVNDDVLAEEVFAKIAETPRLWVARVWDDVVSYITRALRKLGLVDENVTKAELRQLVASIAEGIRRGAPQRTFPQSDDVQFDKAPKDDQESEPPVDFKLDPPKKPADGGFSASEAQNIADDLMRDWEGRPAVSVVQSDQDLPAPVVKKIGDADAWGTVNAAFYRDGVYIVADRMNSRDAVERAVLHEVVGHFGLRKALGDSIRPILNQVWLAYGRKGHQDIIEKYFTGDEAFDPKSQAHRFLVAEEKLAHLAETGQRPAILVRLYAALRDWLRRMGFEIKLNDTDLAALVERARRAVEDGDEISFSREGNVMLSRSGPEGGKAQEPLFDGFNVPSETLTGAIIRRVQDRFRRVKEVQKAIKDSGGNISEAADAYLAEELFHGRAEHQLRVLREDHIEPLVRAIAESRVDLEDLGLYLYAMHAPERNRHIAKINPEIPEAGSGMSDVQAEEVLAALKKEGKLAALKRIAGKVYALNTLRLELLEDSGLESPETIQAWRDAYQHYVPLRGFKNEKDAKGKPRIGRGFDIRGKESRRALGRLSLADNPVVYAVSQLEETAIRAEKNAVGQALLRLVRENPNPDLWVISETGRDHQKPRFDERTKEVVYGPDPRWKLADNVLSVKEDGQEFYLELKDELLARAMKNLGAELSGKVIRGLAAFNRFLAMVNTSLSPEFIVSNFVRDLQTAVINLVGEQDAKGALKEPKQMARKVLKDLPRAIKGAYRALRDTKAKGEWETWFNEYSEAGGKIGFFGLEDIESKKKRLEGLIGESKNDFYGVSRKSFRAVHEWIEALNGSVENGVRLATYAHARKAGLSKARAASLARNLTVNFNRKGELGPTLNALYLFFNAGLQGSARLLYAMRSPKVRKIMGGIVVGAFMLAELNRHLAGDEDDDGENDYAAIPEYVKKRNLILWNPWSEKKGDYFKIPLPYGYNVPHVFGESVNAAVHGKDPVKSAAHVIDALIESFNPLGTEDSESLLIQSLKMASPTVTDPFLQLAVNEDYAGRPIMPEQFQYGADKPDSERYFRSVHPASKEITKQLNLLTGGHTAKSGLVDVSPESIEHIVGFLTGSAGRLVLNSTGVASSVVSGEEVSVSRTPFIRRFYGEQEDYLAGRRYYKARDAVRQFDAEFEYWKASKDREGLREFRDENRHILMLRSNLKATDDLLKRLRKKRERIEASTVLTEKAKKERVKEVEERIAEKQRNFLKKYNAAMEKQ